MGLNTIFTKMLLSFYLSTLIFFFLIFELFVIIRILKNNLFNEHKIKLILSPL